MAATSLRKIFSSVHFLVLLGLLVFTILPLTFGTAIPFLLWVKQFSLYLLWVGIFYLTLLVLVPKLLYRNHGLLFAFSILLILFLGDVFNHEIDRLIDFESLIRRPAANHGRQTPEGSIIGDLGMVLLTMIIVGIAIIIAVTRKLQEDKLREQALENERIGTELTSLKSQINPHFFFNVLNTIYGLTELDTTKAKDSIYTLSQMMRYVLYETRNDVTTLEKEISFINNYSKLMSLRLSGDVQVIFDIPPDVKNVEIAPMLLLPFVENAYKHGISSVFPSFIYIGITQADKELQFEVRNSNFAEKATELEESNGIGLANTKRRLDLLYPGRYTLDIDDNKEAKEFVVQLKLLLP
jgi:sensor histidine kinase YesM